MADLTGQSLGNYRLGALIGRGGMASVYRARQESMGRDVAIKVMAAELSTNAEFVARFEREARVIARLQHPHILPVIDFGRAGESIYLVMQLVEGGVLSERLSTPLTLLQVERLLGQVASALAYAHRSGVIHRDLKPTNVLLDVQDNAYLTDFGIAKIMSGNTHLTKSGLLMGTPNYMAPEQWRSQEVDGRTDVYALGMILYEMLVGLSAFDSDTVYEIMYEHLDMLPASPVRYHPGLPSALETVIWKAIAKNAAERYATPADLAADLDRVVQRAPQPDYRPERPAKRYDPVTPDKLRNFDESTYEIPRVRPDQMPDWVKNLEGAPGSKKPMRIVPPHVVVDAPPQRAAPVPMAHLPQAETAPTPAVRPPQQVAPPAAQPPVQPPHSVKPPAAKPAAPRAAAKSPRFSLRPIARRPMIAAGIGVVVLIAVIVVMLVVFTGGDDASDRVVTSPAPVMTTIPTDRPTAAPTAIPTATRPVIQILSSPVPTLTPG